MLDLGEESEVTGRQVRKVELVSCKDRKEEVTCITVQVQVNQLSVSMGKALPISVFFCIYERRMLKKILRRKLSKKISQSVEYPA